MTRVDFYQLDTQSPTAREHFACRLAEKAVKSGVNVLIATQSEQMSASLDSLLWSFRPESFIPHNRSDNSDLNPPHSSVVISHLNDDNMHQDLLINLRNELPHYFSRFARLAEIVVNHESVLTSTRDHWQHCKTRGYPMKHHKITVAN